MKYTNESFKCQEMIIIYLVLSRLYLACQIFKILPTRYLYNWLETLDHSLKR